MSRFHDIEPEQIFKKVISETRGDIFYEERNKNSHDLIRRYEFISFCQIPRNQNFSLCTNKGLKSAFKYDPTTRKQCCLLLGFPSFFWDYSSGN